MNTKFQVVFAHELTAHYGNKIPNNAAIATDIVMASNLEYLSHESVRKWRTGLTTPTLQYLSAITAWLDKPLFISGSTMSFVNTRTRAKK